MSFSAQSPAKIDLGFLPTPLEPLPRLTAHLGGPRIWIKRDDCTGLGGGGNKTRKLEYLMAEAQRQGADVVITAGALQSNHARQTAAAAAKLGMGCVLVLAAAVAGRDETYATNGNMLLDDLFGAEILCLEAGADVNAAMAEIADRLAGEGKRASVIPIGGSNGLGALAYAEAVAELQKQAAELGIRFDRIFTASGSGGTQAGLVAGLHRTGLDARLHGISVAASDADLTAKLAGILAELDPLVGGTTPIELVHTDARQVGEAYGQPTDAMREAVRTVAALEGVLLDPVYTGKAMAGLFAAIRDGEVGPDETILFWHTGGSQGLFAYPAEFRGNR